MVSQDGVTYMFMNIQVADLLFAWVVVCSCCYQQLGLNKIIIELVKKKYSEQIIIVVETHWMRDARNRSLWRTMPRPMRKYSSPC